MLDKYMTNNISGGVVHKLPEQLGKALSVDKESLTKWESLTPLARNEWICWMTAPKKTQTREVHLKRIVNELKEGKRRPCCWPGCNHREKNKS